MKYLVRSAIVIALSVVMFSCSKLTHTTFYEEFNESVAVPRQVLLASTDTFTTPEIPTNVSGTLSANNTSPSLVQSVELQAMTLTITAPAGQSLAPLRDVQIFILTDSLPAIQIASQYNISTKSDTLNMNVTDAQLRPYLLSNSFKIKAVTTNSAAITQAMTVNIYLKFQFQANLLALL